MTATQANELAAKKNADNIDTDLNWVARHPPIGSDGPSRVECWSWSKDDIVETIR